MVFALPEQAPAKAGFAETPGARLWYSDTGGEGPAIVLCHPASQSDAIWVHQQPVFRAAGFRVIAYARRGYGRSEPGSSDAPGTTTGDLVDLLDALEISRAHIIGAAAGGITALGFGAGWPERTLSLTLAGTIFALDEAEWRAAFGRLGIDAVRDRVSTEFLELGPSYRMTDPEGVEQFAAFSAEAHRQAPVRQPSGVDVTFARLAEIEVPVLLVTGEADLYAPPPLQAMVARHVAHAEATTLREVGHAAYWEAPEAFNALVLDFLARHGGS